MSQPHPESGSYRNPSDDAWWRRALDATGATMQLRAYEQNGQEVTWSDAVMNASAAASMQWRRDTNERWANLPPGPLGDLSDGFAQRLAEEYIENGRMGYHIDNTEFLPNVRAQMARCAGETNQGTVVARLGVDALRVLRRQVGQYLDLGLGQAERLRMCATDGSPGAFGPWRLTALLLREIDDLGQQFVDLRIDRLDLRGEANELG